MKTIFLFLFLFCSFVVFGQKTDTIKAKNLLYLEIWGNSNNQVSLNYDRIFFQKGVVKLSFRVGISAPFRGYVDANKSNLGTFNWLVPIELNIMLGRKKHFFEFGLGYNAGFTHYTDVRSVDRDIKFVYQNFYVQRLGYRRQIGESGLVIRASLNSIFETSGDQQYSNPNYISWKPSVGLGLGWSF